MVFAANRLYQPICSIGVALLGGVPTGPAGVREKRGAGAACSTPWADTTVDRARRWSFCAASVQVSTGVTHESVPAKTALHSSRVLLANRSVNILRISGYATRSNWLGTSSADRPRP